MAVGRPRWIEDLIDVWNRLLALFLAALRIEDRERGTSARDRRDRYPLAGAVPRARRINELNARIVRIGRGARQLANDLSVRRIGDIEIDRKEAA